VVLPFRNLGVTNDDSFSDGLADELIDSLGSVPGLRVVARSSAFQFKSGGADIRQIGKRLNVRMVLEGSIRQYGDRLRISVEMDDATNGYRVWSASYDRDSKDALDVQREISKAIVDRLERQFSPVYARAVPSLANEAPVDPEAYRDYLRGIYFWNKNTAAGHKTAIGYLEQALSRDPGYARAYAALARCYIGLPSFSIMPAREAARRAHEFAQKSLELDPGQGEPHIYLGYAAMLSYDWVTAEREFEKGLQMEPGNAVAHRWYANYLLNVGNAAKALTENQIAESLDPVSPYVMIGTARVLHLLGRDDDAIAQNKKVLLLDPNFAVAHQGLGEAYLQQKLYSQAIAEEELAVEESGHNPARVASLAYCYAVSGHKLEARRLLENLLATRSGAIAAKLGAEIYSGLGDKDHAFEYLAKAVEEQDNGILLKLDPAYSDLRTDPRFRTLLDQMRLQ
jgi:serine/threonine-protein kinase